MKKLLTGLIAIVASMSMMNTSFAATGTFKDGPYTAVTPDSGTCGISPWALDTFTRNFTASLPGSGGTYTVVEKFNKGHFLTYAGVSPGNCETGPGDTLTEGVQGTFSGTFTITVTGGVFDSNGSCETSAYAGGPPDGWTQCDTAGWIHGFFGNGATYSIPHFNFVYKAQNQGLTYHQWTNADTGNLGDIGTAP